MKFKSTIFYVGIISVFSTLIYWTTLKGVELEQGRNIAAPQSDLSQWTGFVNALVHNIGNPLALLLAQILTIIFVAKVFGWICTKIGQPNVVGEMIAGIVLGPSFVGMYFPEFSALLFPKQSLGNLHLLSQIGLILFMFIIGMELDLKVLRKKSQDAVVISHASIIIPFALGMGLAYFIYQLFAPDNIQFLSFSLFMGIAMSITAFPVLARIVQERGIYKTSLGTVVITCAAADDITAWCILAVVIAIVKAGSVVSALYTILLALAYVFVMIKMVRPFLKRVGDIYTAKETLPKAIAVIFFLILIISAYATEVIGIHALFGAFMAGAIMPEDVKFRNKFVEKIEDIALILLLPLFFVFTGLRTQIGLLNDVELWKITGLIILVAVSGKFIGSALAAKVVGQNWKDSLTIGALMNTRGLMELVVLNIGFDLGVLSPEIFSMMVVMALTTTFMTGPALSFINWIYKSKPEIIHQQIKTITKYKVLLSFAKPESGKSLLWLANSLTKKSQDNSELTAIHISPSEQLPHFDTDEYETHSFKPVIEEAVALGRNVTTMFKTSADIDNEITSVANKGDYNILLIGLGQSIYEGSLLGKLLGFTTSIINPEKILNTVTRKENIFDRSPFDERTRQILAKAQVPVGILIDKNFAKAERIFIPLFDLNDIYLISYAQKFIQNANSQVVLLDVVQQIKNNSVVKEQIQAIEQTAPNHITLQNQRIIEKDFLQQQDLMLISLHSWEKLIETKSLWLSDIPSTLIIYDKEESD